MTRITLASAIIPALVASFLSACSTAATSQTKAHGLAEDIAPFAASSLNDTLFAFVGAFHGGITVTQDSVLIFLAPATIRNQSRRKGFDWPRVLGSVSPALATLSGSGGRWKIVTERAPLRIDKLVQVDDEVELPVTRFALARPKDGSLAQHWLLFEIADETTYAERPNHRVAYSYIHAPRTLLLGYREPR